MLEFLLIGWLGAILAHVSKSPNTLLQETRALFEQQSVASIDLSPWFSLAATGLKPLILCLGMILGAWSLGRWILKGLGYQTPEEQGIDLPATALGFGLLIHLLTLTTFLGKLSTFFAWTLWGLCVATAVLSFPRFGKEIGQGIRTLGHSLIGRRGWVIALMAWTVAALLSIQLILCLTPEVIYDALIYHLAEARLYALQGRMVPLPWNLYAQFPQAMEMLFSWSLLLHQTEALPKLLHLFFAFGTAGAAVATMGLSTSAGWLTALLFISIPVFLLNANTAMVDFGMSFFAVTSLMVLRPWLDKDEASRSSIILSGLLAGLAMGCKYTGLFPSLILLLFILWKTWSRTHRVAPTLQAVLLFGLCAATGILPWLIKNVVYVGNPFSPFANAIFHGRGPSPEAFQRLLNDMQERLTAPGWKGWIQLPWALATEGKDWHHWLGPAWLGLIGFAWLHPEDRHRHRWMSGFVLLYTLLWSTQTHIVRFLMPALAIGCGLCAVGVERFGRTGWRRWLAGIAIAWMVILSAHQALSQLAFQRENLTFLAGQESRATYLSRLHRYIYPSPSYAVIAWANQHLDAQARLFFIGETRGFHSERSFVAPSDFDQHPLLEWISASKDRSAILKWCRSEGITHILVNEEELNRTHLGRALAGQNPDDWKAFRTFWSAHAQPVYRSGATQLFEISQDPMPTRARGCNPLWDNYWRQHTAAWAALPVEEQLKRYKDLAARYPDTTVPSANLAKFLLMAHHPDQALALLQRVPADTDELDFLKGAAYFDLKRWADARALLEPLAERRPEQEIVKQYLAQITKKMQGH